MPRTPSLGIDQNLGEKFIDRYWGRVPKFTHLIEESLICEVNQDFIELINMFIDGKLDERNLSIELYRELTHFIDKMCNPCYMDYWDRKIFDALNGTDSCRAGMRYELHCNDVLCCNDMLGCGHGQMCM